MSLKIMVAADDAKIPILMRSLATPLGHMVFSFDDYQTAGEKGESQRFDAAFVSIQLHDGDGLDLVRRIRSLESNSQTTIVMLSESDDIPTLRKAFNVGADLVVAKPLAADRLRQMLNAMNLPEWRGRRHAVRLPLFTEVICAWDTQEITLRSLNISESGMLLTPSVDAETGTSVELQFHIAEVGRGIAVSSRIVRKEGTTRFAVEFVELKPEDRNAIQLYVTGHMKEYSGQRNLSDAGPLRFRLR